MWIVICGMQIVKCMSEDCGVQLTQLKVDGGMTANDLFVQMQSDLLGATVCKLINK